ncbi:hypothetical protein ACO1O0_009169 [Amphichorda felina]
MKATLALVALATFAMAAPSKEGAEKSKVTESEVSIMEDVTEFDFYAAPGTSKARAWCGGYTPDQCNNLCYWDGAYAWQCTSWSCRCFY